MSEAELEVDEKASYKQKLDVLQQQEELSEDEEEQEQKEEESRRLAREASELEAQTAQSLLPDSEVSGRRWYHTYLMTSSLVTAHARKSGGRSCSYDL